jgi:glutamate racemase
VLGCTHYPFLLPVIERIAGPGVRVIDPAPAVARQLVHILTERGLLNSHSGLDPESPALELLASGDPSTLHALAARISCEQ